MTDKKSKKVDVKPDKTVLRSLALGGLLGGGGECVVDVKDGKAVRIRPLHYDWKYDSKKFNAWKIKRNGKTLEPLMKALPGTFSLAYKKGLFLQTGLSILSSESSGTPMVRRNPQNRKE